MNDNRSAKCTNKNVNVRSELRLTLEERKDNDAALVGYLAIGLNDSTSDNLNPFRQSGCQRQRLYWLHQGRSDEQAQRGKL